ncbi:uncharacterized protein LODBEIA_P07460 [Lodderomyces beijingensis]|uniref:DNA helicase n=1 Tax=Lodderomyces beijingensis TaxID=1775926 RepID=A0ABP0ZEE7_9ASCO
MSEWASGGDENDEEDDIYQKYKQTEVREGIAFLIEITPDLLQPSLEFSHHQSKLYEILSSINELAQELIKTRKNTGIGIYFYNNVAHAPVSARKKPLGFCHLFPLVELNAHYMKRLSDLVLDATTGIIPLDKVFEYQPMANEEHLATILSKMIDQLAKHTFFNKRRLVWITTNDKPYTKQSSKESLWRVIDDYYEYKFLIDPFFIKPAGAKEFNFQLYKDLFMNTNFLKREKQTKSSNQAAPVGKEVKEEEEEEEPAFGFSKDSPTFQRSMLGSQIRDSIMSMKNVRRVLFTCNLVLSNGGTIGGGLGCTIKAYQLYSHEKVKTRELLLYTRDEEMKKVYTESLLVKSGNSVDSRDMEIIKNKNESGKSNRDQKEESMIQKGFTLGGGQEILMLNKEQMDFMKDYTFDHQLQEKSERDPNDIETAGVIDQDDDGDADGEEIAIKAFSKSPYLQLVGFRDVQHFNMSMCCGYAIYVSADLSGSTNSTIEGTFTNSLRTFASLYRSCVKLKQYAIVFGCLRRNMRPRLFAMYPTGMTNSTKIGESKDESRQFPEGFLLIRMPWVEDVRALPGDFIAGVKRNNTEQEESSTLTDGSLVKSMKQLIRQHEWGSYNPQDWPNASLNYFYNVIKHEILKIPYPPVERSLLKHDKTIFALKQLKAGLTRESKSLISEINQRIGELTQRAAKRELEEDDLLASANHEQHVKKQKRESSALSEEMVLVAWKNASLQKFNIDQLRGFCRRYPDIRTASRKAELIENIKEYLEANRKKS